ncbi:MAG: hypothetical protein JO173_04815 [Gammaproteobacteria bacterium]|nr:hypothetical protein [Gammaproteobacteria bacterium]MBV8496461.1 hypothetical protein [Gammaproteobacteria bacterium]
MRLSLRAVRGCAIATLVVVSGCVGGPGQRTAAPAPVVTTAAAGSTVLGEYLQMLQRLVQGQPAEQAEITASAQHEYDMAPTPSHELRLALILGTPGHPSADLPKAQGLLRELMANPEVLLPGERSLAFLELSQIDDHLTLETENRRLQADAVRADHERIASANHRLQTEMDENVRLRKELDEARAKLDAIANIERSVNERKPGTTGR